MRATHLTRVEIALTILVALLCVSCDHGTGTSNRDNAQRNPGRAVAIGTQASSAAAEGPAAATQPPDNSAIASTTASRSDQDTTYAAPSDFPKLSGAIRSELEMRGCRIPQPYEGKAPQNLIQGEFAGSGKDDVAVLCSKQGVSSILIFWKGSAGAPAEIAPAPDINFVQVTEDGKRGFSRLIARVGKDFILRHYKDYGGATPPSLDHDGIEDRFIEKGSTVHYFYSGQWFNLTGSD